MSETDELIRTRERIMAEAIAAAEEIVKKRDEIEEQRVQAFIAMGQARIDLFDVYRAVGDDTETATHRLELTLRRLCAKSS